MTEKQFELISSELRELREEVIALRVREEQSTRSIESFWARQWDPTVKNIESMRLEMQGLRTDLEILKTAANTGIKAGAVAGGGLGAVAGYIADLIYRAMQ